MKNIIKTTFALFFVLISNFAFAQHMSVESFRCFENDLSARAAKVEDINNELCALIILNTPEQGFEFAGCNVEKVVQKTGEVWVFVSPGVKFITIKHRNFGSIRNYAFPQRIESGYVYEMKIRTAKITQIIEESITDQYLIINSSTPDAKIYINNEYAGRNSARKFLPITQTHSYRVEAPLHHTKSGEVTLNTEDKTTLQIDLDPAYGYLKVNTSPKSGAQIDINGKLQTQTTPCTIDKLEMGRYTVQAFLPMYKSEPQKVDIRDGKTTEITLQLIPNFANAEITCQDKETEIYIDGEFKAKGSFKGQLAEGSHQLELKKKSHRSIRKTINAISGQNLTENVENLQAINGKLNLDSNPYDAEIFIDGKPFGTTPRLIPQILVGEHKLMLKKDGFKDLQETIKIEEGKIAQYNFTLQEKPKQTNTNIDVTKFKLLQTLTGHTNSVCSASYSPDGTKIVSASYDETIKIWDANTGSCLQTLTGHTDAVCSASYSPDGRKIVSASKDKTIKIWDANTGKCLQTLTGHTYSVLSASYSPDGRKIVSASGNKTIKIWNANTGRCLQTLTGHTRGVISVSYSPDGTKILSASGDNTIKIWDANTGECLKTLTGHTDVVYPASYSPDGKKILSASWDNTIKIWDANTGSCLQTLTGHTSPVESASYSPDGTKIVSASLDNTIEIWDANTGSCLQTLTGHTYSVLSASYSPDGKKIVSASGDKTIKIWGEK